MQTTEKLDCAIYVESNISIEELARLVAERVGGTLSGPGFGRTITTPVCDIEVRRNSVRRDLASGIEKKDEFLYFRYMLEIFPEVGCQRTGMVVLVGNILTSLWSQVGVPSLPATMKQISRPVAVMAKDDRMEEKIK